ncbi:Putative protein of unknown function [Podospora comata]|uniref:Uncharacterized protein n=1 Tax=Podospora comata TaxID=48703 RepID=A0ABY6RZ23_PODCO|nr:Putative protein of unknown function [Podospora comata]
MISKAGQIPRPGENLELP